MNKKNNILATAMVTLALSSLALSPALADGSEMDSDQNFAISKSEARQIVGNYLSQNGYTETGKSAFSARTGQTTLAGDIWQVSVLLGDRLTVSERITLTVDARTGALLFQE